MVLYISHARDERDRIANCILPRVTIPPNAQARVLIEPLFPGAQCTTLIESNKVMWTSNPTVACQREFNIEKDPRTGLMSVHVRSGQYEFQATWN